MTMFSWQAGKKEELLHLHETTQEEQKSVFGDVHGLQTASKY